MTTPGSWLNNPEHSRLLRLLAIATLVLVLRIPVAMIRGLIQEREHRRAEAEAEITAKWGHAQWLTGPTLRVPYDTNWIETREDGTKKPRVARRYATFLPENLAFEGSLASQVRRRGIFDVPVYSADLNIHGRFAASDFSGWNIDPTQIHWDLAVVSFGVSDPRVIQNTPTLAWAEQKIPFEAGRGIGSRDEPGIHAPLPLSGGSQPADFSLSMRIHGSQGIAFAPLGRQTEVTLASDWPHPSFQGGWLPTERSISETGFEARWSVSSLGRAFPQRWTSTDPPRDALANAHFGVDFSTPIDPYRLAERSVKYDALFLGLTFGALWLFEVLIGARVHAIQYLMVGGAMTIFYLLQLSFSEHIGFGPAYALASGGVVALVAGYAVAILGSWRRGLAIGGLVAGLHAALFVLLHDQDHALLVGSLGLFAGLAAVMWLTRRVDWYAPLPEPAPPTP